MAMSAIVGFLWVLAALGAFDAVDAADFREYSSPWVAAMLSEPTGAPVRALSSPARIMPDPLASKYDGFVGDPSNPAKLELKNDHMSVLSDSKGQYDIIVKRGNGLISMKNLGNTFRLDGQLDKNTGLIAGRVFHGDTENGTFWFKANPDSLDPTVDSDDGGQLFLLIGGCGMFLAIAICILISSGCEFTRMYFAKVISSSLTLFVGCIAADVVNVMLSSDPDVIISNGVRAVVFFIVFIGGWALFSIVGWKCDIAFVRTLVTTIVADSVAFFGITAFDSLWKYIVIQERLSQNAISLLVGLGIILLSCVVFVILFKLTGCAREYIKDDDPPPEEEEEEVPKTFRENCGSVWDSMWGTPPPVVEPPPKSRKLWKGSVKWAENTVVSTVEAFLLFKFSILLNRFWGDSWWGSCLVFGLICALFFAAWYQLRKPGGNERFEHMFASTVLRFMGLIVLYAVAWNVLTFLSDSHTVANVMVFTIMSFLSLLVVYFLGRTASKKREKEGVEQFGFFHVSEVDEYGEKVHSSTQGREPMEIAAVSIPLAIALFNCLEDVITAVSAEIPLVKEHHAAVKGFFALVVTIITGIVWAKVILPHASLDISHHKKAMAFEASMHKKMKHLRQSDESDEDES